MPNEFMEKLKELDKQEVAQLYKTIFSTPEGQLVLEDLSNRCWVKTTTFTPYEMEISFKEGMRAVFLHIDTQINYEPEQEEPEGETD